MENAEDLTAGTSRKHPRSEDDSAEVQYANGHMPDEELLSGDREETGPDSKRHQPIASNFKYLVIHRVACSRETTDKGLHEEHPETSYFEDTPRLFAGDSRASTLRGTKEISDVRDYLERHADVILVAYKNYQCDEHFKKLDDRFQKLVLPGLNRQVFIKNRHYFDVLSSDTEPAQPVSETLDFVSGELKTAMDSIVSLDRPRLSQWATPENQQTPFPFFFHYRRELQDLACKNLPSTAKSAVQILLDCVEEICGPEYAEAEKLFAQGLVSKKHLSKLFRKGDVIIQTIDHQPRAFSLTGIQEKDENLSLDCWSWSFNGTFTKETRVIKVDWPHEDTAVIQICKLEAFPLRYDRSELERRLKQRGEVFWSCRNRRFIVYRAPRPAFDVNMVVPRYMVDYHTYQQLHIDEFDTHAKMITEDTLSSDMAITDGRPAAPFLLLLPARIQGYGFHDKRWRSLLVEYIHAVEWNKHAFDRLVLKQNKKELIEALVTVHLKTSSSADIIEGKGNGLIILLHGGPGTGKTLTAESVAELAEKPLYRVTCGDIGTNAEDVEKYLEAVLHIGSRWGCVVLLDEADVFLEERTQQDLKRNALVSVFLRVLEYYNGILILTSNRVGTFDEAFKSRVQLAVHYPSLDESGRRHIWRDALEHLEPEEDFDRQRLLYHVEDLGQHQLNGRQIRNTVRSAVQLAHFRSEKLRYEHFEKIIEIATEFEDYLVKTQGQTAAAYAKALGIRS